MMVFATGVTLWFFTFFGIAVEQPFVRLLVSVFLFILSKDFGEAGLLLTCYFERVFIVFQFVNRGVVRLSPDAMLILYELGHLVI